MEQELAVSDQLVDSKDKVVAVEPIAVIEGDQRKRMGISGPNRMQMRHRTKGTTGGPTGELAEIGATLLDGERRRRWTGTADFLPSMLNNRPPTKTKNG